MQKLVLFWLKKFTCLFISRIFSVCPALFSVLVPAPHSNTMLVTKERIFFLGWSVVHVCPSYHQCHTVLYPDVHLRDTWFIQGRFESFWSSQGDYWTSPWLLTFWCWHLSSWVGEREFSTRSLSKSLRIFSEAAFHRPILTNRDIIPQHPKERLQMRLTFFRYLVFLFSKARRRK